MAGGHVAAGGGDIEGLPRDPLRQGGPLHGREPLGQQALHLLLEHVGPLAHLWALLARQLAHGPEHRGEASLLAEQAHPQVLELGGAGGGGDGGGGLRLEPIELANELLEAGGGAHGGHGTGDGDGRLYGGGLPRLPALTSGPWQPLRILISNDDGVFAGGIRTLAAAAVSRGHQVTVVCPDQERSATGHGLTLQTPIRAERADELFADGIRAWACSGTPSDCVKLALFRLLDEWARPGALRDQPRSQPGHRCALFRHRERRHGGHDRGAARPGGEQRRFQWRHFEPAADLALAVAEAMLARGWPAGTLLNLNVPPLPAERFGPLRWCRTAVRRYTDQFDRRTDPRGRTYYWLAGEVANDLEAEVAGPEHWPTDVAQIAQGGPSLTPLQPELFWRGESGCLPPADALVQG